MQTKPKLLTTRRVVTIGWWLGFIMLLGGLVFFFPEQHRWGGLFLGPMVG